MIYEAHFLGTSNEQVGVFTNVSFLVINLITLQEYTLTKFAGSSFEVDDAGNIFTCQSNTITEHMFLYLPIIDESEFYMPLMLTEFE